MANNLARFDPAALEHRSRPLFTAVKKFDDLLAAPEPLEGSLEGLFQGPVADALNHVGQIAMLRRLAGSPSKARLFPRGSYRRPCRPRSICSSPRIRVTTESCTRQESPLAEGPRYVVRDTIALGKICFVAQSSLHLANAGLRGKLVLPRRLSCHATRLRPCLNSDRQLTSNQRCRGLTCIPRDTKLRFRTGESPVITRTR